jgi:hypothetical protein
MIDNRFLITADISIFNFYDMVIYMPAKTTLDKPNKKVVIPEQVQNTYSNLAGKSEITYVDVTKNTKKVMKLKGVLTSANAIATDPFSYTLGDAPNAVSLPVKEVVNSTIYHENDSMYQIKHKPPTSAQSICGITVCMAAQLTGVTVSVYQNYGTNPRIPLENELITEADFLVEYAENSPYYTEGHADEGTIINVTTIDDDNQILVGGSKNSSTLTNVFININIPADQINIYKADPRVTVVTTYTWLDDTKKATFNTFATAGKSLVQNIYNNI